ncbi:MAG: hypothetical protein HYX53_14355 [Chloroflexi bacterium]|nr:hypothetical protein [Chloroflexota bacterium]
MKRPILLSLLLPLPFAALPLLAVAFTPGAPSGDSVAIEARSVPAEPQVFEQAAPPQPLDSAAAWQQQCPAGDGRTQS